MLPGYLNGVHRCNEALAKKSCGVGVRILGLHDATWTDADVWFTLNENGWQGFGNPCFVFFCGNMWEHDLQSGRFSWIS